MATLSGLEKKQFEDLLGMSSGYVSSFSNNSFGLLFESTVNINIFDSKYDYGSGSKANRMRAFWEKEPDVVVGKLMKEVLSIWEYENDAEKNNKAFLASKKTVSRLLGIQSNSEQTESEFLEKDFGEISVKNLPVDAVMHGVLDGRLKEATTALKAGASLSAIFMCGSILEGALLGLALRNPQQFNQAASAPRDKEGKVKPFPEWTLSHLINVSCDLGFLKIDVKKFSHVVRDFRNYIHPYMQMASKFNPDQHTANICMQVLKAAIAELSGKR